ITIKDEREDSKYHEFHFPGGVSAFIEYIDHNKKPLMNKPVHILKEQENTPIEITFHYNEDYTENLFNFVNNVNTMDDSTHMVDFKSTLTHVINNKTKDFLPKAKKEG